MSSRVPYLILLYGFVGAGKSTLAQKYLSDNPLALNIEADVLVSMHGRWQQHEDDARQSAFELLKAMSTTHLRANRDVVVPYFLTSAQEAETLAALAKKTGARFFEFVVDVEPQEATRRLFKRGTWGEPGAPPLTKDDLPIINALQEKMASLLEQRPQVPRISSYEDMLFVLSDSSA